MSRETRVRSKDWLNLTEDEAVVKAIHPSIWPAVPQIGFGILLCVASVYATLRYQYLSPYVPYLGLAAATLGIGLAGFAEVRRRYTWYVLTDEEIYKKHGIFSTTTRQARYDNLQDISLGQSVIEGIFNFGDVYMTTSGTATTEFTLEDAMQPELVKQNIAEHVDDATERTYINRADDDTGDTTDGQ